MDPIKLQMDMRHNQEELQDYVRDLRSWTEEMRQAEKTRASKAARKQDSPTAAAGGDALSKATRAPSNGASGRPPEKVAKSSTPSEEVLKLKEAGNDFLKRQLYDKAVEKYTAAMDRDQTYALLPANRGMAYLKLKQYERAESDCSRAIQLDPQYIKAYLRRGTARLELGWLEPARADFLQVLEMEPHNRQARADLERIRQELQQQQRTKPTEPAGAADHPPTEKPKPSKEQASTSRTNEPAKQDVIPPHLRSKEPLRKVDIVQVKTDEELEELLNRDTTSGSRQDDPGKKPSSASSESPERAETTPVGDSVVSVPSAPPTTPEKPSVASALPPLPPPPRTAFQFLRDWKLLRQDRQLRRSYLRQIAPTDYPQVFRESMEADILADILANLEESPAQEVVAHLHALSQVRRITVLTMFMERTDKERLSNLLNKCSAEGHEISSLKRVLGV